MSFLTANSTKRLIVIAIFLGVVAADQSLHGHSMLTMRVTPAMSFAPAFVRVQATIETDTANRFLEISADSGNFYRSSQIQLHGDEAPRVSNFEFRNLPAGTYAVTAVLGGINGQRAALSRTVMVVAGN